MAQKDGELVRDFAKRVDNLHREAEIVDIESDRVTLAWGGLLPYLRAKLRPFAPEKGGTAFAT